MLTAAERSILRRKLEQYEGRVPHMYLDTDGNVTVGVGHLLAAAEAARKLPFLTGSHRRATPEQISDEYEDVATRPVGYTASWYSRFTELLLPNADIDRLTEQHIDSFHRELRVIYPAFDRFPSPVRLALFDMIFNLGATQLRTEYPKMNRAIRARNWTEAAVESNRLPPISPARNSYIRGLLEKAGAAAGEAAP